MSLGSNSRIVVYTAIFGAKDDLHEPYGKRPDGLDVDFVCVTDNPKLSSAAYRIILQQQQFEDVTKNARNIKINGFEGMEAYDVAIWHDSSIQMRYDALGRLAQLGTGQMISAFHHRRYCAYLEAVQCIAQKKDAPLRITAQMYRYFRQGFPANYQLHETTIMVLNCKNYLGSELQSIWWHEIKTQSRRDQLSLAYARWKTNTEGRLLDGETGTGQQNPFSIWHGHRYGHYEDSSLLRRINFYPLRIICQKLIYGMRRRR